MRSSKTYAARIQPESASTGEELLVGEKARAAKAQSEHRFVTVDSWIVDGSGHG